MPSRSNTIAAVTKVPPLGRSTLTFLPLSSLMLRTDFDAMHVHFFVVELGHIGELLLDVLCEALLLEIIERVGPHDAEIDALQEQDVGDALY